MPFLQRRPTFPAFAAARSERFLPEDAAPARGRSSAEFVSLLGAYRATGGTARAEDIALMREERGHGNYVRLARLLAAHEVFGFRFGETLWMPMFQFSPDDMAVQPIIGTVLAALPFPHDGWAQATWFVAPHRTLSGRKPVDLLPDKSAEVLRAAHAEAIGLHDPS